MKRALAFLAIRLLSGPDRPAQNEAPSTFTLDRTDFGVLGARWSGGRALLSREVNVHLLLGASGK